MDGLHIRGTPSPSPTIDTVGTSSGKVVHPKDVVPPGVDPSRLEKWRSDDNVPIGDPRRRYDSTVDRDQQILWPDDLAPNPPASGVPNPQRKGFTGRWGPRVASDMETRRTGMRFPMFWLLFFEEMVRSARPSNVQFLTVESGTTWKVPNDWNSANNSIECTGGGGVDVSGTLGAGGAGGGGAYSKTTNLTLTSGADIAFKVGAGGARTAAGGAAGAGGDTFFNGTDVKASSVGARGGAGANGVAGGAGGVPDGAGQTLFAGGGGGNGGGSPGQTGAAADAGNNGGGGGGGGASNVSTIGGKGGGGGIFGGGGGGGGYVQSGTAGQGGSGANGLIVITNTP